MNVSNMQRQPIVSIVIPCYNDGAYLQQAIDSCLAQTYEALEILVVDDGSSDQKTRSVLSGLNAPRIKVLHTNHVGPSQARNTAIAQACGQYILPLDADDWIEPEYVAHAANVLDEQPEVGIVYCHAELFGEKSGPWSLPNYSLDDFLVDNCIFITAMFRKEDWQLAGGFSQEFKHGLEDYDFWLSLIERGRTVHQFSEVWFHYRIKPASRSTEMNTSMQRTLDAYALLHQRHRAFYQQHMDAYCLGLRKALICKNMLLGENSAVSTDPVGEYWQSIRMLKPRLAARVEKLLTAKKRVKEALQWLRRR